MKDLQELVATSFSKIAASGVIEEMIEKKLVETIGSVVNDSLRSYSDFGKQVSEAVKVSMQVDLRGLGLPGYNDLILKIIRQQVNALTENSIAKQVEEQMTKLLAPAPAEIKISKLVKDFIEFSAPDGCECDGPDRISLHIEESSHGSRWISLDKIPGKRQYSCAYRFAVRIEDGRIFGLRIDDEEVKQKLFVGDFYSFERDLFQMYAAGTKVIIDAEADDIDTYYPGRDN